MTWSVLAIAANSTPSLENYDQNDHSGSLGTDGLLEVTRHVCSMNADGQVQVQVQMVDWYDAKGHVCCIKQSGGTQNLLVSSIDYRSSRHLHQTQIATTASRCSPGLAVGATEFLLMS